MFQYEYQEEFYEEYMRTVKMVFSDDELNKNNIGFVQEKLKEYKNISFEVVETETLFDKKESKCFIMLIIICSRLLLEHITEEGYHEFIKNHLKLFQRFYEEEVMPSPD